MRVFAALLSFLGSRVWLVGVVVVSGAILGLILAMPLAPEIERKPFEWCFDDEESEADNDFIARSNRTTGSNREALMLARGARLIGSIEEIPHVTVINVSAQSEEPSRERR